MVFHYLPKNYKSQNFNFQTCLLLQIPIVLCTNSNPVYPFFTYQTIQIMRAYKTHFLCFPLYPNHPSHTQSFTKIDRVTLVFKRFSKFWYQNFQKIRYYKQQSQKKFFDWLRGPQLVLNLVIIIFVQFFCQILDIFKPFSFGRFNFFSIHIFIETI